MLTDGDAVPGKCHDGTDVSEGLQDEAAVNHARVGDHDDAGINDPVTKVEDIDVDHPRGVWLGTGSATEVILDGLSVLEESRRLAHVIDFNYGIEEVGCILGAVNGLALVDGSLFEVGAVRGEGAEEISGGSQIGKSVAQIGACLLYTSPSPRD